MYCYLDVVTRQDREWNHPDVLDKEPYALVVTVADRDNERASSTQRSRPLSSNKCKLANKCVRKLGNR
ncbi:hypothetical protein D3C85_1283720 [compost metagenome]